MKSILKHLYPRIVLEKDTSPDNEIKYASQVDADLANKAAEWWKDDKYTNIQRYKRLKWLGITFWESSYKESIDGNYLHPSIELIQIIRQMQAKSLLGSLDEKSKVFEPGCNVGANLISLQDEYRCQVEGMDISEKAVNKAHDIWEERVNYRFIFDNVLTTKYFEKLPNNFFDLTITKWHLIHVPFSEEKKKYLEQLKRISKALVIFEPVKDVEKDSNNKVELYYGDEYCLSWDNWEKDYGLKEYVAGRKAYNDGTRVFYFVK